MPTQGKSGGSNRGFAAMDEKKQKEIASKGGKASHQKASGSESSESGRKGGQSSKGGNR